MATDSGRTAERRWAVQRKVDSVSKQLVMALLWLGGFGNQQFTTLHAPSVKK